jgi:DNA-binding NarL/FixJ family response regulator
MSQTIRVLIADDHELVRHGLRELLAKESDLEIVGDAGNGLQTIALVRSLRPDIVLLDLLMPGMPGLEILGHLVHQKSGARIVVLTGLDDDATIFQAMQLGAAGYLLKRASPAELAQAIRAAAQDGLPLDPHVAGILVRKLSQPPTVAEAEETLTARERQILALVAEGKANGEIARQLVISEHTVRAHVCRVLKKLNLTNRTQAALYFLKERR